MRSRIPYSCQTIDEDDIRAVGECLRSDFLTQGPRVSAFERGVAEMVGAPHCVAVSNCTAALHLVCLALGLKEGDLLWTSPNSFVASANAARYLGADVDFVDIDPAHGSLDPEALAHKLAIASDAGRLPNILIAVHFAGHTKGFDRVVELCEEYGVILVEDAAHAFGAVYEERPDVRVGAHPGSVAATFSFHPLKSITTGEGGLITTNLAGLADKVAMLRSHGIIKDPTKFTNAKLDDGAWYYEQSLLGFNYRLCDIQAALGLSQLAKLGVFIEARRARARRYADLIRDLPLLLPPDTNASSWHLYVVRIDSERTSISRKVLFEVLRQQGIEVHVHYIPIHTQPYYRSLGFVPSAFEQSVRYYAHCLSLPIYPSMTDAEQNVVAEALRKALTVA